MRQGVIVSVILVVDDDERVACCCARMLSIRAHVKVAHTLNVARRMFDELHFDCSCQDPMNPYWIMGQQTAVISC